jgi:polyisoprenoid-binding protein YceI
MMIFPIPAVLRQLAGATTVAVALSLSGPAFAQVDAQQSSIVATVRQMHVPLDGKFGHFDAQVVFDPARPASGSARVSVDMSSFDLGESSLNEQVQGKAWFDVADYPSARFVSSAIVPAGGGKYSVTGRLTIRGKTQDVIVPVSVTEQAHSRVLDGSLPIRRHRFGIGQGVGVDTRGIADDVVIKFHLVVAK